MTVIPFPRLEQVAPSCSSLRELVRQLCQRYPRLRANPSERGLRKRNCSILSLREAMKKTAVCLHFSAVRRIFARKMSGYEKM
ncbi:MAG: MoaD/ThiS family protein [Bacteroidaceae bacterium]|nr:MoaD/ThiS family protein [Bacteroidaceae bacterium]